MPRPPKRWREYTSLKDVVEGTRFIPFKTPYKEVVDGENFSPNVLMRRVGNLGFVLNLVKTDRYYNPSTYREREIQTYHVKLEGHGQVPTDAEIERIGQVLSSYMKQTQDTTKLIGVHCTHGVNRTGYIICWFMITKLGIAPRDAVDRFQEARGHVFDREEYVDALLKLTESVDEDALRWHSIGGTVVPWEPLQNEPELDLAELLRERRQRLKDQDRKEAQEGHEREERRDGDSRQSRDFERESRQRRYEYRRYDDFDRYHRSERSRRDMADPPKLHSSYRRDRSREKIRREEPEWVRKYVGPRRHRSPSPRDYARRDRFEYSRYVGPRRRDAS